VDFLRPEQAFPSLEALKAQIAQDCLAAKKALA
jgi:riboflavin kinase/FMN adenylyltransferase